MKYTVYTVKGIEFTGNNKAKAITAARRIDRPATVEDGYGIIFENKAQKEINKKM